MQTRFAGGGVAGVIGHVVVKSVYKRSMAEILRGAALRNSILRGAFKNGFTDGDPATLTVSTCTVGNELYAAAVDGDVVPVLFVDVDVFRDGVPGVMPRVVVPVVVVLAVRVVGPVDVVGGVPGELQNWPIK